MKHDHKSKKSNATKKKVETLPNCPIAKSPSKSEIFEPSSADKNGLTDEKDFKIVCFACYTQQAIEKTVKVLQAVGELTTSRDSREKKIVDGIVVAEHTLEEFLEELRARHHGEGLPAGNIPVRPLPYVVTPEKKTNQTPGKPA
jgi:hypothetical protein